MLKCRDKIRSFRVFINLSLMNSNNPSRYTDSKSLNTSDKTHLTKKPSENLH